MCRTHRLVVLCGTLLVLGRANVSHAGSATTLSFDCFPKFVTQKSASVDVQCYRNADSTTPRTVSSFRMNNTNKAAEPFFQVAESARITGSVLRVQYRADGSQNDSSCTGSSCRTPYLFSLVTDQVVTCKIFNPFTTDTTASNNFCKNPSCPCQMLEGDCDSDDECANGLRCRLNVGASVRLSAASDLCYPSACPTFNASTPSTTFCTPGCPCYIGEGNCRSDSDCMGSLICNPNRGASYGLPASYGVCEQCPAGCSTRCPCGASEGDCSIPQIGGPGVPSNDLCLPTLTCRKDVGASYGMSATTDVCVPAWK